VTTRYTAGGAGIVFINYEWSYISFEGLGDGAQSIDVGGFNYGAKLEFGGNSVRGILDRDGSASDFYDVPNPTFDAVPYEQSHTKRDLHAAFFETGSDRLSPDDRYELRKYVDRATARFASRPRTLPPL
jgi:hypothetical protein